MSLTMRKNRRSMSSALVASLLAAALVFTPALPASADQVSASGRGAHGEVRWWPTARTNMYTKNLVQARLTWVQASTLTLWVALRNSAGTTYARGNTSLNSWATIQNDNGNTWNPPGTFYLNTQLEGSCSGGGCADIQFSFDFLWNVSLP